MKPPAARAEFAASTAHVPPRWRDALESGSITRVSAALERSSRARDRHAY